MKMKLPNIIAYIGIAIAGSAHAGVVNISTPAIPVGPVADAPGWHGGHDHDGHRLWAQKDWDVHQRRLAHEPQGANRMSGAKQHGHNEDHRD